MIIIPKWKVMRKTWAMRYASPMLAMRPARIPWRSLVQPVLVATTVEHRPVARLRPVIDHCILPEPIRAHVEDAAHRKVHRAIQCPTIGPDAIHSNCPVACMMKTRIAWHSSDRVRQVAVPWIAIVPAIQAGRCRRRREDRERWRLRRPVSV